MTLPSLTLLSPGPLPDRGVGFSPHVVMPCPHFLPRAARACSRGERAGLAAARPRQFCTERWGADRTLCSMDVGVTELRAHLSEWVERVRAGGEVVITDRGVPVARLVALGSTTTVERLTAEGVIGRSAQARRPVASGRRRPRPRRPLSDLVSEQRR